MENGHTILERNFRSGRLEIDIISMDRNGIHFVEVKSRVFPMEARPEENVTRSKQRKVADAARRYLSTHGRPFADDMECHFDVISVRFGEQDTETEYFPDAFIPGL
jgi:putative endonuclease